MDEESTLFLHPSSFILSPQSVITRCIPLCFCQSSSDLNCSLHSGQVWLFTPRPAWLSRCLWNCLSEVNSAPHSSQRRSWFWVSTDITTPLSSALVQVLLRTRPLGALRSPQRFRGLQMVQEPVG